MNCKPLSIFCFWLIFELAVPAQTVPPLINYQGRLATPNGSPLPTADYQLTFNLYDSPTNGNLIWGPQIFDIANGSPVPGHGSVIPVVQGYFNVMLGPTDTNGSPISNAFTNANAFVEITVSNRPPIAPRQQVLSAPYAFQAAKAAMAVVASSVVSGSIQITNLAARQTGTNIVGLGGVAVSASSGDGNPSDGTTWTNLTVTIFSTGRPMYVGLIPDGQTPITGGSYIGADNGSTASFSVEVTILRDDIPIAETDSGFGVGTNQHLSFTIPCGAVNTVDLGASAGTNHTYTIHVSGGGVYNSKLVAFEL